MRLRTHPPNSLAALAVLVFVLTAIVSVLILWTRLESGPEPPMPPQEPPPAAPELPPDPPIARPSPGLEAPVPQKSAPIPRRVRVVVDPGHGVGRAGDPGTDGRSDPGMIAPSGTPEYLMTWVVAEQVRTRIEALAPDTQVLITKHSAMHNLSNLERARQLGDSGAEIFLSIHFDDFAIRGRAPRRTHAIVLPERFRERIGGRVFKTNNRNQPEEIVLAKSLVEAVVKALHIPGAAAPVDGGVKYRGTGVNKGVLFETTPDWVNNAGPNGELWEERLYHAAPETAARGLAVLLEIENMRNRDVDGWFNDQRRGVPHPSRYRPISDAIAQVIVNALK